MNQTIAIKIAAQFGYDHCDLIYIGDYLEQYELKEEGQHLLELYTDKATWRIFDCSTDPDGVVLYQGELQLTFTVL